MSIQQHATLVDITFGLPRQSVQLETVARGVEADNSAEEGVVRSSGYYFRKKVGGKKLDGLRLLKQFQQSWANELKHYARYPFAGGFKLLPSPLIAQFMEVNKRFQDSETEVWQQWSTSEYPQWRDTAPSRMGELFNERDFPSLEECRSKFICEVTMIPMAPVDQWRHIVALAPDIAATMQAREEEAIARVTKESHAKLWEDIMKPLRNVVEQLSKDKRKISKTLIESVSSIAQLVPAYNAVIKDDALDDIASKVMQTLSQISVEDLRNDPDVRELAIKTASDLIAEFDPYARSFELDEDQPAADAAADPTPTNEQETTTSTTEGEDTV